MNANDVVINIFSILGRSFCPGLQKCALSRRGSGQQVTSTSCSQRVNNNNNNNNNDKYSSLLVICS